MCLKRHESLIDKQWFSFNMSAEEYTACSEHDPALVGVKGLGGICFGPFRDREPAAHPCV